MELSLIENALPIIIYIGIHVVKKSATIRTIFFFPSTLILLHILQYQDINK